MKVISTPNAPAAIGPYAQGYIANGMVFTSGQLPADPAAGTMPEGIAAQAELPLESVLSDALFKLAGELSLDGSLKPVRGVLPVAVRARSEGLRRVVLPAGNAAEAAVVDGIEVIGATTLREVVGYLNGEAEIAPAVPDEEEPFDTAAARYAEDFADVRGQTHVRRALEIAAAGGHNVIMIGAPGSGKTMLARRLPTILPPLSREEALETTKIHSVAGKAGLTGGLMTRRPFRAPHHLTSQVAVIGGGQSPRPGEVSLAHNGVLFLDELPEFGRSVLEVLRQPLEEKKIVVSRARYSVEYPANFTLVAAMNPCPCGYYNHPTKECTCSPGAVHRYMGRISGPLMDRIDLHVEVTPVAPQELSAESTSALTSSRSMSPNSATHSSFKNALRSNSISPALAEACTVPCKFVALMSP